MKMKKSVGLQRKRYWTFLEHNGPMFPRVYKPLPAAVKFRYNSKAMQLSPAAEEIASFFAKLLHHKLARNPTFSRNFFNDWRHAMTAREKKHIKNLRLCDFRQMHDFLKNDAKLHNLSPQQRVGLKKKNEKNQERYGYCNIDGRIEKIANFKIEPPGLFIGRGRHPLMGKVKRRIKPSDVTINCSLGAKIPRPPHGQRWKAVIHDNTLSWLVSWNDTLQRIPKYIYLDGSSRMRAQKESQKFEVARTLNKNYKRIARKYMQDLNSNDEVTRQSAVAIYFIDKLGLRAGNEKSMDSADTVGCCSLRVEHLKLRRVAKSFMVGFDFLGKDSIRFKREIKISSKLYHRLMEMLRDKPRKAYVFNCLTTSTLNKRLRNLMPGLTARVFRTRMASVHFEQLLKKTPKFGTLEDKINFYKEINARVAILCNHKKTTQTTTFRTAMVKIERKIKMKRTIFQKLQNQLRAGRDENEKSVRDKLHKIQESIRMLESKRKLRELCNQVSLSTSKLNYLDPRITVNWCKQHKIPVEKVYGKSIMNKFKWAMRTRRFRF